MRYDDLYDFMAKLNYSEFSIFYFFKENLMSKTNNKSKKKLVGIDWFLLSSPSYTYAHYTY